MLRRTLLFAALLALAACNKPASKDGASAVDAAISSDASAFFDPGTLR